MPLSTMFNPQPKTLPGKVVITEIANPFGTGAPVQHVVRSTADDAVVATEMTHHTDVVKGDDMTPVMCAFVEAVQTLVKRGNAVRISGLGTFYIKAVLAPSLRGSTPSTGSGTLTTTLTGEATSATAAGDVEFGIGFTPDRSFCQAAQRAQAEVIRQCETKPAVETVQNMDTMEENTMTSGKVVLITGKRLRVAGDSDESDIDSSGPLSTDPTGVSGSLSSSAYRSAKRPCVEPLDGTGLFIVPCDSGGGYKVDRSDWVRVKSSDIGRNVMTQVLFRVPAGLAAGKYRIGICTRAPLSGSTREELLIRKPRCSVSRMFEMEG